MLQLQRLRTQAEGGTAATCGEASFKLSARTIIRKTISDIFTDTFTVHILMYRRQSMLDCRRRFISGFRISCRIYLLLQLKLETVGQRRPFIMHSSLIVYIVLK